MNDKNRPLISVAISTLNPSKDELTDSINSIMSQTFSNFEIILVDDGSSYPYNEIIDEVISGNELVKLIRHKKPQGLAASLNSAISMAKGEFIARMDDDDFSDSNRFMEQVEFLQTHPRIMFVGTNAIKFGKTKNDGNIDLAEFPNKIDFLWGSPFIHPTVMFRSEVFKSGNKYSVTRRTRRTEDYDLFMRLYSKGMFGANIQKRLFRYSVTPETMLKKRKYRYRIDEAVVRSIGFKELGLPWYRIFFVIKPLLVGLIPQKMIYLIHKKTHR